MSTIFGIAFVFSAFAVTAVKWLPERLSSPLIISWSGIPEVFGIGAVVGAVFAALVVRQARSRRTRLSFSAIGFAAGATVFSLGAVAANGVMGFLKIPLLGLLLGTGIYGLLGAAIATILLRVALRRRDGNGADRAAVVSGTERRAVLSAQPPTATSQIVLSDALDQRLRPHVSAGSPPRWLSFGRRVLRALRGVGA
ncbi:MAG: hypothetical protein IT353_15055 [Gemmatimonadaceae bacterium]|nr:hypothetical protein [Gemmatimonadaceae bacterium]